MGYVKGEARTQGSLFPTSLDELVPEDHVCRVIEAFVDSLDLAALGFQLARPASTGRPPYDPADLLKLYLYGYLHQIRSTRRLERESQRNIEVMWLLGRLTPDFKTIARFRQYNGEPLRATCARFVQFCRRARLLAGDWVAIDGSKFRAGTSGKAVWSAKRLARERRKLQERIDSYLTTLDEVDEQENEHEVDPEAVREALAQLEQRRQEQEQIEQELEEAGSRYLVRGEPESRVMRGHGPAYNVQSAVDAEHHLIVYHQVSNEATDNRSLAPVATQARDVLALESLKVVADAGYANGEQLNELEEARMTPYVAANRATNNQNGGGQFQAHEFDYDEDSDTLRCPAGKVLTRKQLQRRDKQVIYQAREADCHGCALKAQCTSRRRRLVGRHLYEPALQRAAQRTRAQHMRLRRSVVEHPFGSLKYQIFGHPRFLLRGLQGAATEMALGVLAYNLRRAMKVLGSAEMQRLLRTA